ncbi:hypothetical protein DPM19_26485 [Actinomadura craniellae]|uniref:Ppx/GppA phosphatase N-terminal domain-containing protein n=1 Tax=Actinomadura craniellae TaxID=2231787 RepID=A0A365GZJ9_9ACTN|nr:hypothetical protein [Actinomadura craniellae]RAY12265.1 hypothetical protein DPM19_26485 [Actinomadura craniellae]
MRAGVLDVGSRSTQLLVTDLLPGRPPTPVHRVKYPVRLAEATGPGGEIERAAVRRLARAVARAADAARDAGAAELIAYATSAVRDAANATEVVEHVTAAGGVRLGFLSGATEARLTFRAARAWFGWSAGPILLADIGGGSLEIAYGDGTDPQVALSLPLGAGRLTREHLPDDPPGRKRVKRLRRRVRDHFAEVLAELPPPADRRAARPVAASRTFEQLAILAGARQGHAPRRLELSALRTCGRDLATMEAARRARLRGVSAPRSRQIVAGAAVAEAVMVELGVPAFDLCPWALREGIALRRLQGISGLDGAGDIAHLIQPFTRPGPRRVPVTACAST